MTDGLNDRRPIFPEHPIPIVDNGEVVGEVPYVVAETCNKCGEGPVMGLLGLCRRCQDEFFEKEVKE